MTVYRFEQRKATTVRDLDCTRCGKRFRRQKTFTQTINPFNKNPDGTVRTAREVTEAVRVQAEAWQPEPVLCGPCKVLEPQHPWPCRWPDTDYGCRCEVTP